MMFTIGAKHYNLARWVQTKIGYHKLHNNIFIGGADDIEKAVQYEGCNVVSDLRSEVSNPSTKEESVEYIHIPIIEDVNGNEWKWAR